MKLKSWQLRHSRLSVRFIRAHSLVASLSRLASNFSGVETLPRK